MMSRSACVLAIMLAMFIASIACACPFCDSETAQETRAGIFNDQFVPNLFTGVLPFVIVIIIALAIHLDWSRIVQRAAPARKIHP